LGVALSAVRIGLLVCALALTVGIGVGCTPDVPGATGAGSTATGTGSGKCGSPTQAVEGCPCATAGASAECGTVHSMEGTQAVCSMGHAQCLASGAWGACTSDRVEVRSVGGLKLAGLGAFGACADPCSPWCSTALDTPPGLVVDGGLDAGEGGLTLTPSGVMQGTCTGLTISPSSAPATNVVVTSMTTPATLQFTSTLTPSGCNPVAPDPLWYTGTFDVATIGTTGLMSVITPIAVTTTVGAKLGSFTSATTSQITVSVQENATSNPPPSGATFADFPAEGAQTPADPNLAILYPYGDTMLPLSLPAPLLQWSNGGVAADGGVVVTLQYPPTGTTIFSVSELASESTSLPVQLRTAQPRYTFPQANWFAFEQTVHRNRAALGDAGRILVRRRVGATTYHSQYVDVHFAPGQLKGRIYYNSYGTALVSNYGGAQQSTGGAFPGGNFGAATLVIPPGATSPSVAAGYNGGNGCFVCHSVSADGTTLLSASQNGYVNYKWALPGAAPSAGVSLGTSALGFGGINPGATRVLSSSTTTGGDSSTRLFTLSGSVVASNLPSSLQGGMPSFATDGSAVTLAFRGGTVPASLAGSSVSADGKSVVMMNFDGNATFSSFRTLATPASGISAWPAFLPAGQGGIVYQVETRTSPDGGYGMTRHDCECSTYSGATGELWWVSTGATPQATRLHRANGYDITGTTGTLPTMPPTGHAGYGGTTGPAGAGFYEQRYNYEPSVLPTTIGGYSWVVFTSRRMWGNVATINPYASDPRFDNISIDPTPKKLWVAAISNSPTPGTDPSWPAFYLPGQELIAGNSRAAVALQACAVASSTLSAQNLCDSDLDCCGAPATAACVIDPPPLANPVVKHCLPVSASVCRAVGQTCAATASCCNASQGGACANGICTDPPPYYAPATYTRVFASNCVKDTLAAWSWFEWQAATPSDSKIDFFAEVSDDGATWAPASPLKFASAHGASVVAPAWANGGQKMAVALGSTSGTMLRLTFALYPSADNAHAPTLYDWRQSVDCVPYK
jgi:hypothetical protein